MPPPPQSAARAEGELLSDLTRSELSERYVEALRAALAGATARERRRWWELPPLPELHREFRRRYFAELEERMRRDLDLLALLDRAA